MNNQDVKVFAQAAKVSQSGRMLPGWFAPAWFAVAILPMLIFAFVVMTASGDMPWALLGLGVVFMGGSAPIYLPWLRRVKRYEITSNALIIVRAWPFGRIVVTCDEIELVTRPHAARSNDRFLLEGSLTDTPLQGLTVPMSATEGFIVLQPDYVSWRTGSSRARVFGAVTDPRNLVLIEGKRNFLLSPERPDEFVACLRQAAERTNLE